MTSRVLVTPTPGRLVRIPGTYQRLPDSGLPMEIDSYWIRKERAGDVSFPQEQTVTKQKEDK